MQGNIRLHMGTVVEKLFKMLTKLLSLLFTMLSDAVQNRLKKMTELSRERREKDFSRELILVFYISFEFIINQFEVEHSK